MAIFFIPLFGPGTVYSFYEHFFKGNGRFCENKNECFGFAHDCDVHADCHDESGIYLGLSNFGENSFKPLLLVRR